MTKVSSKKPKRRRQISTLDNGSLIASIRLRADGTQNSVLRFPGVCRGNAWVARPKYGVNRTTRLNVILVTGSLDSNQVKFQ